MPVLDGQEIQSLDQMIDTLKSDPDLGRLTLKAEAEWNPEGFESRVVANPVMQGSGGEPMYAEELLEVLARCLAFDALAHSGPHQVPVDALHVQVEGDIDFAGSVGLDAPAGFTELRMDVQFDTPASEANLEKLAETVQRVSIVAQSLSGIPQRFKVRARKTTNA